MHSLLNIYCCILIYLISTSVSAAKVNTIYSHAKEKLSSKFKYKAFDVPQGYDALQIPHLDFAKGQELNSKSSSFNVTVTLRIIYVSYLDEMEEEITINADLMVQWKDEVIGSHARKNFNISDDYKFSPEDDQNFERSLDQEVLKKIWKPDIYIENLVKVRHPQVMSQPVAVRLNQLTGEFVYISRMQIIMECEMDFHYYPADTQSCQVVLRSNSHDSTELNLEWGEPRGVYLKDCGGPNYDYHISNMEDSLHEEGYVGNHNLTFAILTFDIMARRKLSYHMLQTYLPSIFFIIITSLCFFVPSRMVEARIGIAMTTLLTLTAMFASVRESTPSTSYVKAIDIWMLSCIFFVFLTLLEFSLVLWLNNLTKEIQTETSVGLVQGKKEGSDVHLPNGILDTSHFDPRHKSEMQNRISDFIEKYGFLIFSFICIVFSIVYWSWLLIGSGYFDWEFDSKINEC